MTENLYLIEVPCTRTKRRERREVRAKLAEMAESGVVTPLLDTNNRIVGWEFDEIGDVNMHMANLDNPFWGWAFKFTHIRPTARHPIIAAYDRANDLVKRA